MLDEGTYYRPGHVGCAVENRDAKAMIAKTRGAPWTGIQPRVRPPSQAATAPRPGAPDQNEADAARVRDAFRAKFKVIKTLTWRSTTTSTPPEVVDRECGI